MSTDDRDIESSNPSKNFTVGNFDQGSGFFTPVWESKRRIRSEPPGPPSSKGGANRAEPSSKSPSRSSEPPPPSANEAGSSSAKVSPVPRPRASGSRSQARSNPPTRGATPVPPSASERSPSSASPSSAGLAALPPAALLPDALPPAVAAVFDPDVHAEAGSPTAATNISDRPTEPPPAVKSATPSAAARALQAAGPNLPPAAFLDEEPEFRSPRPGVPRPGRTDRSPLQYRTLRATSAATRVHEQLKAKLQAEAAEIDESRYDLEPETNPNPLQSESSEFDPYPLSLMRRLRRTIRLSTPVPDAVRSLIAKYDRG